MQSPLQRLQSNNNDFIRTLGLLQLLDYLRGKLVSLNQFLYTGLAKQISIFIKFNELDMFGLIKFYERCWSLKS